MDIEKYRNISFEYRKNCMICGKETSNPIIQMPEFPLTEVYINEKPDKKLGYVDQVFHFCKHCGHGQIENVIDVNLQYGNPSTYHFRTSQSITGRETTEFFVKFFEKTFQNNTCDTIVEVGCNDLYLLKQIKSKAKKLIGIDPILKGKEDDLSEENISVIGDFYENVDLPDNIDVVLCKDVLEHVNNPKEFLKKMVSKASNNTLFVIQVPILETILEDCRFDQIFHQHLNYFTLKSFIYMLEELNCGLIDFKINYNHWGAGLFAFRKGITNSFPKDKIWDINKEDVLERYRSFEVDMKEASRRLHYFESYKRYGYGAALMLPVISYYLKDDLSCLECIIDDDKAKEGLYYLNLTVPVKHISEINDINNSVILLTAISSKINIKRILKNLFELEPKYIIYPLRTL